MQIHYKILAVIAGCLAAAVVFCLLVVFGASVTAAALSGVIAGISTGMFLVLFWQRSSTESAPGHRALPTGRIAGR